MHADKLLALFPGNQLLDPQNVSVVEPKIPDPGRHNPKSKIQNLIEPLSDRELEVLHLVAAGHSNTEIADRLIVATSTVKTHVNRIFGKLAVESRTQAIVRARELGLLGLFLTIVLCNDFGFLNLVH